jgi:site-specific DNA recombinase
LITASRSALGLRDEAGERLTPSRSNRGGLRYRYYISKSLVRGRPRADEQGKRWRIPAAEIENAVLVALGSFLDDHSALSSILSLGRLPPAQTASVLKTATAVSRSLSQEHTGQPRSKLQSILSRIEIGDTTLTITVALGRLREALKLAALSPDEPHTHAIVVPARITKRGIEQKLIIGGGVMAPLARDEPLVKAVARAYSWVEDIRMRRVNDLSELAVREQLTRSYVQAHLALAFLAPSIVGAILEGRQPGTGRTSPSAGLLSDSSWALRPEVPAGADAWVLTQKFLRRSVSCANCRESNTGAKNGLKNTNGGPAG